VEWCRRKPLPLEEIYPVRKVALTWWTNPGQATPWNDYWLGWLFGNTSSTRLEYELNRLLWYLIAQSVIQANMHLILFINFFSLFGNLTMLISCLPPVLEFESARITSFVYWPIIILFCYINLDLLEPRLQRSCLFNFEWMAITWVDWNILTGLISSFIGCYVSIGIKMCPPIDNRWLWIDYITRSSCFRCK
jgi:hypothetical protein